MTASAAEPTADLVLLILQGARDLIAKPGAWCQKHIATDSQGRNWTGPFRQACALCGVGAIYATEEQLLPRFERFALLAAVERCTDLLHASVPGGHFPTWQDQPERTQAEVVSAFEALVEYRRLETDRGTSSMEALEEAIRDQPYALMGE